MHTASGCRRDCGEEGIYSRDGGEEGLSWRISGDAESSGEDEEEPRCLRSAGKQRASGWLAATGFDEPMRSLPRH